MSYYFRLGEIPHKPHTAWRKPDGSLYHEELMGLHGFSGIQSLVYHLRPPTEILRLEEPIPAGVVYEPKGALRPRHLFSGRHQAPGDLVQSRKPLFGNDECLISIATPDRAMDYHYRFAHGDEMLFVHDGSGRLETQFGHLSYRPGDYLVLPTGTLWRHVPDAGVAQRFLIVEAMGHITPPKRYLNDYGQFLEHSPYRERDIRPPEKLVTIDEKGEFEVRVKARGAIHRFIYGNHPHDIVGWDGHLWPFAFNIEDFEPITGRIHQPPPVHQTFDGPGFVICSFVPRLFDYHHLAIPAPYHHSNVDSDEVLYYAEGQFMSRKGIERASLTIHPNGIPHGPHPGTYEGSIGKAKTDELAVMIDTFRPLHFATALEGLEDPSYWSSWTPKP